MRWIFAGGRPYTPFDIEQSKAQNQGIYDVNKINEARYPDYHSLNLRFDKRFYFHRTNLICYVSLWNAYNRKNVAQYYWNKAEKGRDIVYQWSLMPILGLEFEF
ncbi:MAG: hypothetical protein P8078_05370 [bacterium]